MNHEPFNLDDPAFLDRCAKVRRDLEAGVPLELGEIADRLEMSFDLFVEFLSAEMFRQDPELAGVVVGEVVQEALH